MRIKYRLSREDYWDAKQMHGAVQRRVLRWSALALVVLMCSFWVATGRRAKDGYSYLLICIVLAGAYFLNQRIEKKRFERAYREWGKTGPVKDFTVDISEEGFHHPDLQKAVAWSTYSKYSESDNAFIMFDRKGSIYAIFPKRALDADEVLALRQLLKENLGTS